MGKPETKGEMWAAAPTKLAGAIALLAAAVLVLSAAPAGAAEFSHPAGGLPAQLWGVEIRSAAQAELSSKRVTRLRAAGVNALVVDASRIGPFGLGRVAGLARSQALALVVAVPGRARPGMVGCRLAQRLGAVCAILTSSLRSARSLASRKPKRGRGLLVVRLSRPSQISTLRARTSRRVIAVPRLSGKRFSVGAWRRAIEFARASATVDLAVRPTDSTGQMGSYLGLLHSEVAPTASPTTTEPGGTPTPSGGSKGDGHPTQPAPAPAKPGHPAPAPGPAPTPRPGHPSTPAPAPAPAPVPPSSPSGDPIVAVSPSGDDATCVRGDRGRPCRTFGRGYAVAQPGDTVAIACGTYPGQVVTRGSQSQSAAVITFVASPAHCATVVGWINLGENSGGEGANAPNNLTIDGVDVVNGSLFTWWNGGAANRGLTLRNMKIMDVSSAVDLLSLGSWDGLRLENLELGPACCQAVGVALGRGSFSAPLNRNIVMSNLYIHDLYDTCGRWPGSLGPCSGVGFGSGCGGCRHIDGVQITDAHDIRISGSRIERLDGVSGQGIFFATANGGTFSNITIEGNTVGNLPQDDILVSGPGTGIVTGYVRILNNVSYGNIIVYGDGSNNRVVAPGTEVLFSGNTGDLGTSNESDRCVLVLSNGSLFRPTWTGNTNTMRNCDT